MQRETIIIKLKVKFKHEIYDNGNVLKYNLKDLRGNPLKVKKMCKFLIKNTININNWDGNAKDIEDILVISHPINRRE